MTNNGLRITILCKSAVGNDQAIALLECEEGEDTGKRRLKLQLEHLSQDR
jgi:hypothetical protein